MALHSHAAPVSPDACHSPSVEVPVDGKTVSGKYFEDSSCFNDGVSVLMAPTHQPASLLADFCTVDHPCTSGGRKTSSDHVYSM